MSDSAERLKLWRRAGKRRVQPLKRSRLQSSHFCLRNSVGLLELVTNKHELVPRLEEPSGAHSWTTWGLVLTHHRRTRRSACTSPTAPSFHSSQSFVILIQTAQAPGPILSYTLDSSISEPDSRK